MIGSIISHYKILEKLGEGGMGVVYKAHDTKLNREVAIKFLPLHISKGGVERDRFLQEAQAVAALNHPNICVIHEINDDAEQPFIVMEYVDGSTIRTKLENSPMKVDDAIKYGIQIGEALHEAHTKGIVHRDIKADNIIINSKGQAKVMDFGLAKLKGSLKLTRTSSTVGTLAYMAPEQIQGGEVDSRSDIFAFAVLFFEMLTGRLPFRGEHEAAMVYSIVNEDSEPIQKYLPEISGEIVHTLGKALEKDPENRYQHIQDMVVDLRRSKKDTSRVGRLSTANQKYSHQEIVAEKSEVHSSKKKLWIGVGALAVIIIVGSFYYFVVANNSSASLPPTKTSRLTSYGGEEYDPALSPDGKSIAFSWNGEHQDNFDIYVKLVDAGVPVRLTTNLSIDNRPVWSHDGSFIAFVRENEIKTNEQPRTIFIIPAFGGKEQKVVEYHPGLTDHPSISWSSDNKSIYFTNWSKKDNGFVIFKVNIQTQEIEQVTQLPQGTWGDQMPSVSPDGKYVAFIRRATPLKGDIFVKNLTDNSIQSVTTIQTWIEGFSWSSDNRSIIFSANIDGSSALWKAGISESTPEKLMSGINMNNPSESITGNRLVYAETIENTNIWKIDLQNPQKETELISSSTFNNGMPDISPDGKKIIFSSNRTGNTNVWSCEFDGTNQTQVTFFSNYSHVKPLWSPNGLEMFFHFDRDAYLLNAAGGASQKIFVMKAFPTWNEDGTGFYSSEYPENKLYSYLKDGTPQKRITQGTGIMPRVYGSYIYYIKDFDHHEVWRIPITGGEEEPVLQGVSDFLIQQWVVAKNGIYFIRANKDSPILDFYNFHTKQILQIKKLPQAVRDPFIKIAIAPDESYILYSKQEPTKSDIILVENFK